LVRLELERAVIRGDGFLHATTHAIGFPEVRMSGGMVRREHDGLAHPLDGEIMASQLVGNDAEMVQCIGVVGLHGKDLPVKGLSLRQPPRMVVLEGQGESLWDRDRGHGEGMTNGE